jgi:outer membrane protein OmpA-like peptidoglycan-associated protein
VSEQGTAIEQLPLEAPPNVEVVNQTSDDRYVINIGINVVIYTPYDDRDRVGRGAREVFYEELSNGRVRQVVIREDGTQVITTWNRYGEILTRVKVLPDGRRIVIAYYDDADRGDWRDPGDDLPPFVLRIPVTEYVLYSEQADEDELVAFLDQPPLEQAQRVYSIDEVKRSARIRDTVRRVDIGDVTFDTGEATVERDQVGSLTLVAAAMKRLIDENPSEVFLIEGHTDAVGSNESNLELSDKRAETIADLLVDIYNIPPENLTTQGYGEEYLKVETEEAERANRRVQVRRITPLVASADAA